MIRKSTSDVVAVDIVPVPYCEVGATGNHLATQVDAQSDRELRSSVLTVSPAQRGPSRPCSFGAHRTTSQTVHPRPLTSLRSRLLVW